MIKVLELVADYPDLSGGKAMMFVHTRNQYYIQYDIDVTVLNFSSKEDYVIDNIKVISKKTYNVRKEKYDILICHAANIRNHYFFLKKYGYRFPAYLFFFHGHEVLPINKVYSKPYSYMRKGIVREKIQDLYDCFKLYIWSRYIPKINDKSVYIFVSQWMENEFYRWIKVSKNLLEDRSFITYNCVAEDFETDIYNVEGEKQFDFVTVRGNLDGSKYSIDLVNKWAENTPSAKFLIVGEGKFFEYYKQAENIVWLNQTMNHEEIKKVLNESKFALMPTRTDAQGLMMCEMAAFGIPIITSDIPVCHEIFDGFANAYFVENSFQNSLDKFLNIPSKCIKDKKFLKKETLKKEIELIKNIIEYKSK